MHTSHPSKIIDSLLAYPANKQTDRQTDRQRQNITSLVVMMSIGFTTNSK